MTNFIVPIQDQEDIIQQISSGHYNHLLVQQIVRSYFANLHTGSKKQKNISEVRGGGRKPFPQKGRGKARVSSIRCTIWRGGAKVFAARGIVPKPHKINKRMYAGGMRSLLTKLYQDKQLNIINPLNLEGITKTRDFYTKFSSEAKLGKHLIIDSNNYEEIQRLTNNLVNINVSKPSRLYEFNPVSLLKYDYIWITTSSIPTIKKLCMY